MRDEIEKLVAAGLIASRHVEPLLALLEAGFCQHRSWGFGRITTLDGSLGRLNIDFPGKPGHSMDLGFSAESLKPVPADHILARKHTDLEGLKREAALHHLDVVRMVVRSFGGEATLDQIMKVLVPDVIESDWKKWWDTAKAEMKRDGHFLVPLKKSEPIVYHEEVVSAGDRLREEFAASKGLKARLVVATEVLKSIEDLRGHGIVPEVIAGLVADIQSHQETMPALALEAIFMRDDLRQADGLSAVEGEPVSREIWARNAGTGGTGDLVALFGDIPAAKHRRALESFRDCVPDWGAQVVMMLNEVPAKLAGECCRLLLSEGRGQLLKDTLARLISQHGASSELLLWLGKERNDHFADILGPEVFRAMLTAMERDAFNERKSNRLRDFILEDQNLLPELIESADVEIIKDLVRTLQLSPAFDDMDKRSLLARVVKQYPVVQSLITGDQKKEDHSFLVSWASLERRKAEYDELVNQRIPANVKDIAVARSYGDLRENHEYKSAKETQKVLHRRKHELERDLARARGTDFSNPRTDVVSPGTTVRLTDLDAGATEEYTVVGAWDGDPDRSLLSYLTPFAQALLNRAPGEEVSFESDGAVRRLRIDAVTPPAVPVA